MTSLLAGICKRNERPRHSSADSRHRHLSDASPPAGSVLRHEALNRLINVDVEVGAVMPLSSAGASKYVTKLTLAGNRQTIEQAVRRVIDREGPSFVQSVRVTAQDV